MNADRRRIACLERRLAMYVRLVDGLRASVDTHQLLSELDSSISVSMGVECETLACSVPVAGAGAVAGNELSRELGAPRSKSVPIPVSQEYGRYGNLDKCGRKRGWQEARRSAPGTSSDDECESPNAGHNASHVSKKGTVRVLGEKSILRGIAHSPVRKNKPNAVAGGSYAAKELFMDENECECPDKPVFDEVPSPVRCIAGDDEEAEEMSASTSVKCLKQDNNTDRANRPPCVKRPLFEACAPSTSQSECRVVEGSVCYPQTGKFAVPEARRASSDTANGVSLRRTVTLGSSKVLSQDRRSARLSNLSLVSKLQTDQRSGENSGMRHERTYCFTEQVVSSVKSERDAGRSQQSARVSRERHVILDTAGCNLVAQNVTQTPPGQIRGVQPSGSRQLSHFKLANLKSSIAVNSKDDERTIRKSISPHAHKRRNPEIAVGMAEHMAGDGVEAEQSPCDDQGRSFSQEHIGQDIQSPLGVVSAALKGKDNVTGHRSQRIGGNSGGYVARKERNSSLSKNSKQRSGQTRYWTQAEHNRFLDAVACYGEKAYVAISNHVETRTPKQVRTHAQKFQMKMARLARTGTLRDSSSLAEQHLGKVKSKSVKTEAYRVCEKDGDSGSKLGGGSQRHRANTRGKDSYGIRQGGLSVVPVCPLYSANEDVSQSKRLAGLGIFAHDIPSEVLSSSELGHLACPRTNDGALLPNPSLPSSSPGLPVIDLALATEVLANQADTFSEKIVGDSFMSFLRTGAADLDDLEDVATLATSPFGDGPDNWLSE